MDWKNKYVKYKEKYLELKNNQKGGNKYIKNKQKILNNVICELSKNILVLSNKKLMIKFINHCLNTKFDENDFDEYKKIKIIIRKLSLYQMIDIDINENFGIRKSLQRNSIHNFNKLDIDEYIEKNNLHLSYSIYQNNLNLMNLNENIYPMHSIGKVFTGFLIMLLLNEGIITDSDINSPIKLDKKIIKKLNNDIVCRLKETTMLDIMTHKSGLTDYLGNYFNELEQGINSNPTEPEDFVKYIDLRLKTKGKFTYSNVGILLCGLSIKYIYNLRTNSNLTYNQILFKYIVEPAELNTFSISKPKNSIYQTHSQDNISKELNGSPAGGYWISSNELAKFGNFMINTIGNNPNIKKYLELYGEEFYSENRIQHSGGLQGSSCWLIVFLDENISVGIMDIDGKSSGELKFAIEYL